MMVGQPVALVVSIVGLVKDTPKRYAVAGLALSGVACAVFVAMLVG